MLLERNQNMKNNIKDGIMLNKEQLLKKQFDEAERIKLEKREQAELVLMQKQQEQLKAASIKQLVRNQQQEAEDRRRQEQAAKKAQARAELQQKIIKENQRRLAIEVRLASTFVIGRGGPDGARGAGTDKTLAEHSDNAKDGLRRFGKRPQWKYELGTTRFGCQRRPDAPEAQPDDARRETYDLSELLGSQI